MLIENIELTMSHASLGNLDEYGLLVLFGNAHSHHLTMGLENNPGQILDNNNRVLYPAYFKTHLQARPHRPLSSFNLWDRVEVGVDVQRFGETLLESTYQICKEDELPDLVEHWSPDQGPFMRGTNLLVVDVTEGGQARKVSVPKQGLIAKLPKIKRPPAAIMGSKKVRATGFDPMEGGTPLKTRQPIIYPVVPGRDAVDGHAMIFAMFARIMDVAEYRMLMDMEPGLPRNLLTHLHLLERETYYYGNCFSGEELAIHLNGNLKLCDRDYHGDATDIVSCALLHLDIEIYNRQTKALLSLARVAKLLAIPTYQQDQMGDIKRFVAHLAAI